MTAPSVPPSTMMAAVTCEMSLILPPSISSPPTISPTASTIPPMLARSGREPATFAGPALALSTSIFGCSVLAVSAMSRLRYFIFVRPVVGMYHFRLIAIQNRAPEFKHSFYHLVGRFQHHEFLTAGHGDHGIRRNLNV